MILWLPSEPPLGPYTTVGDSPDYEAYLLVTRPAPCDCYDTSTPELIATVTVTVVGVQSVDAPEAICLGKSLTLKANPTPPGYPLDCLHWEGEFLGADGTSSTAIDMSGFTGDSITYTPAAAGYYRFRATNDVTGTDGWVDSATVAVVSITDIKFSIDGEVSGASSVSGADTTCPGVILFGQKATFSATVIPAGRALDFDFDFKADTEPYTGAPARELGADGHLDAGEVAGTVTVTVTDRHLNACPVSEKIRVACSCASGCTSCVGSGGGGGMGWPGGDFRYGDPAGGRINPDAFGGTGLPPGVSARTAGLPGTGSVSPSASVEMTISLGAAANGHAAGNLRLHLEQPSSLAATPTLLDCPWPGSSTSLLRDPVTGSLRQVSAAQTFVDIVPTGLYSYDIRFFVPEAVQNAEVGQDGFLIPAGTPFVTWAVSNPDADHAVFNRLHISRAPVDADPQAWDAAYDANADSWTVVSGNGLRTESLATVRTPAGDPISETRTVYGPNNALVSQHVTQYSTFPWGQAVTSDTVSTGNGQPPLVSTCTYHTTAGAPGYKLPRLVTSPDGSWSITDYDAANRKSVVLAAWKDVTPETATAANCRRTEYSYVSPEPEADPSGPEDTHPRVISEYIENVLVSRTWSVIKPDPQHLELVLHVTEQAAIQNAAYGDPGNRRQVTATYRQDYNVVALRGRTAWTQDVNAALTTFTAYEFGVFQDSPANDPTGQAAAFTADPEGDCLRSLTWTAPDAQPAGVPLKTTGAVEVQDAFGRQLLQETWVLNAESDWERIAWTLLRRDAFGRVTETRNDRGDVHSYQWACCGLEAETPPGGETVTYLYDALKRPESRITTRTYPTPGNPAETATIVDTLAYDAAGHVVGETLDAGGLTRSGASSYDAAGRILTQTDAAGLVTSYAYSPDGRTTTVTRPGGATQVTTQFLDGRTKSVTGTGVTPQYYDYGVNADGTQWTKVYTGEIPQGGSFTDIPMWEKSTTDFLGRTVRTEKPSFVGATVLVAESFYNTHGQLWKSTAPGTAPTLMEYNTLGEATRSGLDVNGNDTLDLASGDRIQEQETVYQKDAQNNWWRVSTSKTYPTADSATALVTGIQKQRLSGLGIAAPEPYSGVLTAESISTDVHGAQTASRIYTDRDTKTIWQVTSVPTATNDSITQSVNGLIYSVSSVSSVVTYFLYDALGRQVGVTDPRISTFDAQAGTWQHINVTHYNALGQVDWTEDTAGNRTSYIYDTATGQRTAVTDPLGQTTWTAYTVRGQVWRQWGATYPVEYEYDAHGRMLTLKTFRGGDGWFTATWPAAPGTPDVTQWIYDPPTGLLQQKLYADNKGPSYTYTAAGKLATRTWARTVDTQPLITSYSYSPATGELTGIDYSDSTPDVTYTYTRIGQQATVTDACGARSFEYSESMELEKEDLPAYFGNRVITRQRDALGRDAGLTLGIVADPPVDPEYWVGYGYDVATGRFSQVASSLFPAASAVSYGYLENSDLLHSTSFPNNLVATKAYEPQRNLIDYVENKVGATTISKYDYTNDAAGRRTARAQTGTAFAQADTISWGYNARNEVTSGVAQTDPNYNFGYGYDPIGNRLTSSDNVGGALRAATYSSNPLNQYTGITTNGTVFNPVHDDDGNMTLMPSENGVAWTLTWDAENRLTAAESATMRLEFAYDYMFRRVSKKVLTGTPGNWVLQSETRFVYDGWNLVSELSFDVQSSTFSVLRSHVWGLDLSQSLQGAGGVGGLLYSSSLYYSFDANGNISELTDSAGAIWAHYEYDPFGGGTSATGPGAAANTFRFSTKFHDPETSLVYYGYRYYAPGIGRWASRDWVVAAMYPEEYLFLANNSAGYYDVWGLYKRLSDNHLQEILKPSREMPIGRSGHRIAAGLRDNSVQLGTSPPVRCGAGRVKRDYWVEIERDEEIWYDDGRYSSLRDPALLRPIASGHMSVREHELAHYNDRMRHRSAVQAYANTLSGMCACPECHNAARAFLDDYLTYKEAKFALEANEQDIREDIANLHYEALRPSLLRDAQTAAEKAQRSMDALAAACTLACLSGTGAMP